eukprot:scaffold3255_cov191-Ochromonas_danica.AAC.9
MWWWLLLRIDYDGKAEGQQLLLWKEEKREKLRGKERGEGSAQQLQKPHRGWGESLVDVTKKIMSLTSWPSRRGAGGRVSYFRIFASSIPHCGGGQWWC